MKNKKPNLFASVLIILYFAFAIVGGAIICLNADIVNASYNNYIKLNEKSTPTYIHVTLENMEDLGKISQVLHIKNDTDKQMIYDIKFYSVKGNEELSELVQVDVYRNGQKHNFSGRLDDLFAGGRSVSVTGGQKDTWCLVYNFDDTSLPIASHGLSLELVVKISVYSV